MCPSAPALTPQSLPYLTSSFVGRQEEISELQSFLKYTIDTPRIVSITGRPGIGKSTLAICMGNKLMDEGVDVIYIDMNEVTSVYTLAYKILRTSQNSFLKENITVLDLYKWSLSLKHKTLLVLDNCDQQLHTNKDELQRVVKRLTRKSHYSYLKILTTSRQQVAYIEKFKDYVLYELPSSHACQLLLEITDSLNERTCEDIANITGSVPLALHVIGALLNMPNSPTPADNCKRT